MCRKAVAWIETQVQCRKYQNQKDQVRALELTLIKKYPEPVIGPFVDHPNYSDHLVKCMSNFRQYMRTDYNHDTFPTWLVGDSIAAQARDRMRSVNPLMNHSLGGMWVHHMLKMINDAAPVFAAAGYTPAVIVVGTPGGNNLLTRQEVNATIDQFLAVLNRLRQLYPTARIIIYNLPQTICAYIIRTRVEIEKAVMKWIAADGNSVFLLLVKGFVSKNRILPKADMSSDGVHMTPLGQLEFDDDIERGKKAVPGSFIP